MVPRRVRSNLSQTWQDKRLPYRALAILLAALSLYGVTKALFSYSSHRAHPLAAQRLSSAALDDILSKCAARDATPRSPDDLLLRSVNDRFETGTRATLIKNVTLWTGARNGTEIVYGDILLDKGLIQGIGYIPEWDYSLYDADVVDANGSWVTPGLGKSSVGSECYCGV